MTDLFEWTPPPGDRGGATYDRERDYARLNQQAYDVWLAMRDGKWRTLRQIAHITGHPEASISARLRDFRKPEFGRHEVDRERILGGLYRYKVTPNPNVDVGLSEHRRNPPLVAVA